MEYPPVMTGSAITDTWPCRCPIYLDLATGWLRDHTWACVIDSPNQDQEEAA